MSYPTASAPRRSCASAPRAPPTSGSLAARSSSAPTGGRWIDHWLDTVHDIEALRAAHPMMDAVIEEIDGRMIRVGEQWLADFASCNYLGFDLDPEIIEAVPDYLERVGHAPELVAPARAARSSTSRSRSG